MTKRLALLMILMTPMTASAATPGELCAKSASDNLRSCLKKVGKLQQACYRDTGAACAPTDPKLVDTLGDLAAKLLSRCPDQGAVQAAGFAPLLTPAALIDRLEVACAGFVASLAARSYGGPHAGVRNAASETDQKCLDYAWRSGQSLADYGFRQQSVCIRKTSAGKFCDAGILLTKLTARQTSTAEKIASKCPNPLETRVAVNATVFAARAAEHARCLVATAHGTTAPFTLDCGPRAAAPVPARGVEVKVVLPASVWGSKCGDGSDYAFSVKLAPTGSPVENVVVHMQGGGFCGDGPSCANKPAGLFTAINDTLPQNGMMSSTDASNPFRDWTKVGLPYCTQDLHIGGGVATAYPEITVQRYGALNVRAAMRWVRDVVWAELDATDPDGYRADRPRMIFSGSSAGGYGAAYNYHWVLDDLGWSHSTAVPDAGLAMDNGTPTGVIALGGASLSPTYPGWNTQPYLPPYCFTGSCAEIFINLEAASSPRLLGVPEQQYLHVANQVDDTQVATTGFGNRVNFVNNLRSSYCEVKGTPGVHGFLRGSSTSIHGQLNNDNWDEGVAGGTVLRDWIGAAMADPTSVVDKVDEGTLVADVPGVLPFPCALD